MRHHPVIGCAAVIVDTGISGMVPTGSRGVTALDAVPRDHAILLTLLTGIGNGMEALPGVGGK